MSSFSRQNREQFGGMREHLFKEWKKTENPTKQEERAYWAGFFRGVATQKYGGRP